MTKFEALSKIGRIVNNPGNDDNDISCQISLFCLDYVSNTGDFEYGFALAQSDPFLDKSVSYAKWVSFIEKRIETEREEAKIYCDFGGRFQR